MGVLHKRTFRPKILLSIDGGGRQGSIALATERCGWGGITVASAFIADAELERRFDRQLEKLPIVRP